MFSRPSLFAFVLAVMVALAAASEPHLRIHEDTAMRTDNSESPDDAGFPRPKMEFDFEKGLSCKGGTDPKNGGAGKKCEGKMKKSVSIGMAADELTAGVASDMDDMFHDLMPQKDGFVPMEEDMMALMEMDGMDIDDMEDGVSKTVKFGGFFKLNWDCTVTFKKEGPLKLSKTVECGGRAIQGMGKGPKDLDEYQEEKEF